MREGGTRLAVVAGGVIGVLGRWYVGTSLPDVGDGWGWATLVVNITGALAMGLFVAWLAARPAHPLLRPFVAVGVLGGWTTYSGFALDVHAAADSTGVALAAAYVLATLVLGVGASLVGLLAGERWFGSGAQAVGRFADEEEL